MNEKEYHEALKFINDHLSDPNFDLTEIINEVIAYEAAYKTKEPSFLFCMAFYMDQLWQSFVSAIFYKIGDIVVFIKKLFKRQN